MSLFRFNFLRRIIRRHTKPIQENTADLWKRRLSVLYMIIAWNAIGFVGLAAYHGKLDWAKYYNLKTEEELNSTASQQWSKILGIQKAKVIRVSSYGINQYEIDNTVDKEKQNP